MSVQLWMTTDSYGWLWIVMDNDIVMDNCSYSSTKTKTAHSNDLKTFCSTSSMLACMEVIDRYGC